MLSSRYEPGKRPTSWDERRAGVEEIETDTGERVLLFSNGGQSSPAVGWELLLTQTHQEATPNASASVLEWTLYGIAPLPKH